MRKTMERIAGDTAGVSYEFPVLRFEGSSADAPDVYMQAALHAGELPGVVAIHALLPRLRKAEAEHRIRGNVTIVPWANPVGRTQYLFGDHQGRFHLGTRTNFNRDFPLLSDPAFAADLDSEDPRATADVRLKRRLLALSLGHDIVLDLHCDDEGLPYLYVARILWPAMADCAAAMGVEAVVLWDEDTDGTFEGASINPYLNAPSHVARFDRRVVTTAEYRGLRDVGRDHAEHDAAGIYRLLVARGVVDDKTLPTPGPFTGPAAPINHVEMISAPCAGAILFDVAPGDRVVAGQRLASIVHAPGDEDGATDVVAPQSGFVLTRVSRRSTRSGDDLIKLVGDSPSASARSGALED